VQDNGRGIDLSKYRDKLFGMYNTFHGNKDAKGLGLFIVKAQIEALKGEIEVKSEVGAGTSFMVYFADK
jgi:two-component system aerobic respiration control sensor histidine kinase ArcB